MDIAFLEGSLCQIVFLWGEKERSNCMDDLNEVKSNIGRKQWKIFLLAQ